MPKIIIKQWWLLWKSCSFSFLKRCCFFCMKSLEVTSSTWTTSMKFSGTDFKIWLRPCTYLLLPCLGFYWNGKKQKNIIKLEVRKLDFYHWGKYVTTLKTCGKLLISHNKSNKHVWKQLRRSFNKKLFRFYLNSLVMAK